MLISKHTDVVVRSLIDRSLYFTLGALTGTFNHPKIATALILLIAVLGLGFVVLTDIDPSDAK